MAKTNYIYSLVKNKELIFLRIIWAKINLFFENGKEKGVYYVC